MGMIANRRELIQFAVTVWPAWVDLLCRKESPQERLRRTGVLRGETFEISETLVIDEGMSVSECEITCARDFRGSWIVKCHPGGSFDYNTVHGNGCRVDGMILVSFMPNAKGGG